MGKYRKKPIVIEAVKWTGNNKEEIELFMPGSDAGDYFYTSTNKVCIHTLEGMITADVGDYIIKGVQGEFYPCKPDIFETTYEKM